MNKIFSDDAWRDYLYWFNIDRKKSKRINELIKSIDRDGFDDGLGKPEPLKYNMSGFWSRRIDSEHRLVYKVNDAGVFIASCKDHYK